jgi:positive regulator of sigma E activity
MDSSTCIEQKGVVEDIYNGLVKVNITSFSACAQCHSKKACGISESNNREIMVPVADSNFYSVGDTVEVIMKRSMGWKATILGYVFPFILVLATLLLLSSLKIREVIVGLGSLAILVPYFTALYLGRERLRNMFSFTIRKI